MIGWLQGQIIEKWHHGLKQGVLLACGGIGYEVQLLQRHIHQLNAGDEKIFWIHQLVREDCYILFGFQKKEARNLFRELISVSGVGPQSAIALLEECSVHELVKAILERDIEKLSKAQGVGKRTAERLAVELQRKLATFPMTESVKQSEVKENKQTIPLKNSELEELESTLKTLGYKEVEINNALEAILASQLKSKTTSQHLLSEETQNLEAWLRAILIWLNQNTA